MLVDIICPNEDCEASIEVEVELRAGSPQTWDDPGEPPSGSADMPAHCPHCGATLGLAEEDYAIETAWEKAREQREGCEIDRALDREEDRRYWNERGTA